MSTPPEVLPLGFAVVEYDPVSRLPKRLASDDLFGDREEAGLEAKACGGESQRFGRRAAYQVCAVVPVDDQGGDL